MCERETAVRRILRLSVHVRLMFGRVGDRASEREKERESEHL